jgi:hypothetical protein
MYASTLTVRQARAQYYQANHIPEDGGASDPWAKAMIRSLVFGVFPNFQARMEALKRHDLHHLLCDQGTTLAEEGLVAGWELGRGCGPFWVAWWLELQALWNGILFAPRRTFALFRRGRHSRNLYTETIDERWLELSLGEMRAEFMASQGRSNVLGDLVRFSAVAVAGLVVGLISLPVFVLGPMVYFLVRN